jgi:hypothetical protein
MGNVCHFMGPITLAIFYSDNYLAIGYLGYQVAGVESLNVINGMNLSHSHTPVPSQTLFIKRTRKSIKNQFLFSNQG